MKKKGLISLRVVLSGVGILMAACQTTNEVSEVENVVLVTIDTIRADHCSFHGYARETTPFLKQLAAQGILFNRAFASTATTAPSHATMLTGLYPLQHNVQRNGHRLNDRFLTITEILRSKRFFTAAFVGTYGIFGPGNLHQGFNYFDEPRKEDCLPSLLYRPAEQTTQKVMRWLSDFGDSQRLFLWVHFFDPHAPYSPPKPHNSTFSPGSVQEREMWVKYFSQERNNKYLLAHQTKMMRYITAYDGEIHYVDQEIKRLFEFMTQKGLNRNSMWIVTGDHGEGLGNHDFLWHATRIYNEQLRTPLIVHFTDGRYGGAVIDRIVEHTDIVPTIAEYTGAEVDLGLQKKPLYGTSLGRVWRQSGEPFPAKLAFSQREAPAANEERDDRQYAVQGPQFKFIYRTKGSSELFNLKEDPYEMNNLEGTERIEENALRQYIVSEIHKLRGADATPVEPVDRKTIEDLKSLGYIQ